MNTKREFYCHDSREVGRFLEGLAAARDRLNRGYESQSALECIVLSAAIVDAMLRIGVLMREQLDRNTSEVNKTLLRQTKGDKILSERWVIDEAEKRSVISSGVASDLRRLYARRNRCIHRYIISDTNYNYATQLVFDYSTAIDSLRTVINALEKEQLERRIGIVAAEVDTQEAGYASGMKRWIEEMATTKEQRRDEGE
jgi:hypothetical protein